MDNFFRYLITLAILPIVSFPLTEQAAMAEIRGRLTVDTSIGRRCLDAASETWTQPRGTIQLYECNWSTNQQWVYEHDAIAGPRIIHGFSYSKLMVNTPIGMRCLDAASETWTQPRGTIQLYDCNDSPNQRWIWGQTSQIMIDTPVGRRCLDAAYETWTQPRGTLQLYDCNDSPNQRWWYHSWRYN